MNQFRTLVRHWGRNWGWKLVSLAASVALWMAFTGERELSTSIAVPVQYRNLPRQLDISSDMVEQVHLHLRGSSNRLGHLNAAAVPAVIDLGVVPSPGERTFSISDENLKLPAGISLERVVPSQIRLRLENRISRDVPVWVRYSGPKPAEASIAEKVIPPSLTIIGPESRVTRILHVDTDPIDAAAIQRAEVQTQVYSGDPQVHFSGPFVVTVKLVSQSKDNNK
jgi:hypothetical protein